MSEFLNMLALIDFLEALISPEIGITINDVSVGMSTRRERAGEWGFNVTLHVDDDAVHAISVEYEYGLQTENLYFEYFSIQDSAERIIDFVLMHEEYDTLSSDIHVIDIGRAMSVYKGLDAIKVASPATVQTTVEENRVIYECDDGHGGYTTIFYYPFYNIAEVEIYVKDVGKDSKGGCKVFTNQVKKQMAALRLDTGVSLNAANGVPTFATSEMLIPTHHSGTGLTDFWDIYPDTQKILTALRGNLPNHPSEV